MSSWLLAYLTVKKRFFAESKLTAGRSVPPWGPEATSAQASETPIPAFHDGACDQAPAKLLILVATKGAHSKNVASAIRETLWKHGRSLSLNIAVNVAFMDSFEFCHSETNTISSIDRFNSLHSDYDGLICVISTWADGKPPPPANDFLWYLEESVQDVRVDHLMFQRRLRFYVVVGLGDSGYPQFCTPAFTVNALIAALGGQPLRDPVCLDDSQWDSHNLEAVRTLADDIAAFLKSQNDTLSSPSLAVDSRHSVQGLVDTSESCSCAKSTASSSLEALDPPPYQSCANVDLEDLHLSSDSMLTAQQKAALHKQGYKIIGEHSAVKLCRWTKAQLRHRGGCYKHTFYGIQSYLCMEVTPSLACANMCVFCWRHHTNPTGTRWAWKTDTPSMIHEQMKSQHQGLIKELKGVPEVNLDRHKEAFHRIRHCALSLVGEPIMYPHINELIQLLHRDRISTFLVRVFLFFKIDFSLQVTNAQFPDQMRSLGPVTQLYVSVDAATPESLKKIGDLHDLMTEFEIRPPSIPRLLVSFPGMLDFSQGTTLPDSV